MTVFYFITLWPLIILCLSSSKIFAQDFIAANPADLRAAIEISNAKKQDDTIRLPSSNTSLQTSEVDSKSLAEGSGCSSISGIGQHGVNLSFIILSIVMMLKGFKRKKK